MLVAVTGSDGRLAARLREEGFKVAECPLVRIEALGGPPIDVACYDWILVTSRNAVTPLLERVRGGLPRVAAIGPGTAEALRERRVEPDLLPEESTQEGLAAALPRPAGRVLFAGGEGARDILVRELGADFVPLYRTLELSPAAFPEADIVTLASASAARALAAIRSDLLCVTIGPVTTEEARRHGLLVVVEASTHDLDGLVAAVKLARSHASSSPS
jgi:uroporphyrinogen-III synthase